MLGMKKNSEHKSDEADHESAEEMIAAAKPLDLSAFGEPAFRPGFMQDLVARIEALESHEAPQAENLAGLARSVLDLAQRLERIERAVHAQSQQHAIQELGLERQTRFSAMDLAVKARGPGDTGAATVAMAEIMLGWLRAMPGA